MPNTHVALFARKPFRLPALTLVRNVELLGRRGVDGYSVDYDYSGGDRHVVERVKVGTEVNSASLKNREVGPRIQSGEEPEPSWKDVNV
jgi:hypothetical protein